MHCKPILRTILVVIFSLLASEALAQDYEIHLVRPSKVGDKYRFTAIGGLSQRAEVTSGNRLVRNSEEKFTYELSADVTVLATDGKGHTTGESFVVVSSRLLKDGAERTFLPPGLLVVATVEGDKTVFKMDGKPLDAETSKVLSSAITLYTGGPDDDETFGAKSRKKVQESWPINVSSVEAMLKEMGAQARKEDIKGAVTLEKVEESRLFINGSITVTPLLMSLPSEFKPEGGEMRAEFSGQFPIGEGNLRETQKAAVTMVGSRRPSGSAPEMRMKASFESNIEYEIRPSSEKVNTSENAGPKDATKTVSEKTVGSAQLGEVKTVWVVPAGFKNFSPYEFISVPATSATPPPEVTVKTGVLVAGKSVKRVEPVYPPLAKQAKVAGKVGVEIIVDEEGNVVWAKATSGHPLLQQAAVEAVRQWKFEPTTFDGKPVKVFAAVSLNFGM